MRRAGLVATLAAVSVCFSLVTPTARAVELTEGTDTRIAGSDPVLGARFAATLDRPDFAVVDILLANGRGLHTEADSRSGRVVLRTISQDERGAERVTALTADDLSRLRALSSSVPALGQSAG